MHKTVKFLKIILIFILTGITVSQENGNIYTTLGELPYFSGSFGTYQVSSNGMQGQTIMPSTMMDMTNDGSKILFRELIYNSGEIDSLNFLGQKLSIYK